MKVYFKTGDRTEPLDIADENIINILNPPVMPESKDAGRLIQDALLHPFNTPCLDHLVHQGEKTVIVISDNTRPCPSGLLLSELLPRLHEAGLKDKDIEIVIARGSHRPCTEEEKKKLTGTTVYEHYVIHNSGDHGYIHLGTTKRGTPVDIDSDVVQAEHRILLGNVEFHYFAGFSGGAKALMPGCADPRCIAYNHRMMSDDDARAGKLEGNPVREDLEEAAGMLKTDFILNVVLNTKKEVIYAAGGDMKQAHRKACAYLSSIYLSPVHQKTDIVIVSQGGFPKDLNLYQTQKALDNAKYAVKDSGVIILTGSCREGFGNPVFERWMKSTPDPDILITRLHDHFELGGHKAAAIALVKKKADIFLVSDMAKEELEGTILTPYQHLSEAYQDALKKCGKKATVTLMPYGGSTLPVLK